ncbi:unnamed protein product, partial [Iphiclides podalirius]
MARIPLLGFVRFIVPPFGLERYGGPFYFGHRANVPRVSVPKASPPRIGPAELSGPIRREPIADRVEGLTFFPSTSQRGRIGSQQTAAHYGVRRAPRYRPPRPPFDKVLLA